MKKYFKLFFIVVSFIFLFTVVNAETEVDCTKFQTSEAQKACENIKKYCFTDGIANMKGCHYDKNDSMYTKSKKFSNDNGWITFTANPLTLTRGYQGATKDDEIVFAGCYKGHYNGNSNLSEADFYVFQIIRLDGGKCKVVASDIVFSKGTTFARNGVLIHELYGRGSYDGTEGMGSDMATYHWTALNGGNCPVVFGVTANTKWYTKSSNKYVFGDDTSQIDLHTSQFWSGTAYETNVGCSVQDEEGFKEAVACYDDAITQIKNTQCPADLSNTDSFKETLNGLATKCDTKLQFLYKVDLLKANAQTFTDNLGRAVSEKLTSCQYSQCNLTSSESSALTTQLASTTCKNGCAGLTGTNYETCMNCLESAFKAAGLSQTKVDCLLKTQKKKDEAVQELQEQVEQEQEQHVEEEIEEGRKGMAAVIEGFAPKAPGDVEIPPEKMTCKEILGENLVKVVKAAIKIIQIAGAIIAIVKGMMVLIPPILAKDQDGLKKATSTLVKMAIILVIIFLFPSLLRILGGILGFDLSCI